MLIISNSAAIPLQEIELQAIRAQGAGGQNVNKVSSAIHLRFDFENSSLPEFYKDRLRQFKDQRITQDGLIIIKAQRFRTQEKNKIDALQRLQELVRQAAVIHKKRIATKPSKTANKKRLDSKKLRSQTKALRRKID